ncbi:Flp family type IVb pilin [uncultured Vibrio sp.]|uniref:Flp family type IVb pilin n=1 Tax=Vibrio sp. TaxID=678 RepID=UPI0029C60986|nr:Flp family type IVb pilin [uncultured Vibrio sp.]
MKLYKGIDLMNVFLSLIERYVHDEEGATAIEYGILAAGLAAGILAIFGSDGLFISALKEKFQTIIDGMNMGSGGE